MSDAVIGGEALAEGALVSDIDRLIAESERRAEARR